MTQECHQWLRNVNNDAAMSTVTQQCQQWLAVSKMIQQCQQWLTVLKKAYWLTRVNRDSAMAAPTQQYQQWLSCAHNCHGGTDSAVSTMTQLCPQLCRGWLSDVKDAADFYSWSTSAWIFQKMRSHMRKCKWAWPRGYFRIMSPEVEDLVRLPRHFLSHFLINRTTPLL
jgi:hypothetical protein